MYLHIALQENQKFNFFAASQAFDKVQHGQLSATTAEEWCPEVILSGIIRNHYKSTNETTTDGEYDGALIAFMYKYTQCADNTRDESIMKI